MIEFKKTGINSDFLRLVPKLRIFRTLLVDIENKFLSVIQIKFDGKLYGFMVVRCEVNYFGELVYIVNHCIAEDNLDIHFSSLLKEYLQEWLGSFKDSEGIQLFKRLRFESDKKSISRILKGSFGDPKREIFEKEIICLAEAVGAVQAPLQVKQQLAKQHPKM